MKANSFTNEHILNFILYFQESYGRIRIDEILSMWGEALDSRKKCKDILQIIGISKEYDRIFRLIKEPNSFGSIQLNEFSILRTGCQKNFLKKIENIERHFKLRDC